jgi:flavin-dependent dehydrogenase
VTTMDSYDLVVVGARCAGAPTAMLAARRGYRVLLLDRAQLPADTLSTHHILPPGLAHLQRWGLLDALAATGCPRIDRIVGQIADVRLEAAVPPVGDIAFAYAPRRRILDGLLVAAAVEAGAVFRDRSDVVDVRVEAGRVVGVTHRTRRGQRHSVRARLVVGADGMRSTVANLVGAATELESPVLTCAYYTYWMGVDAGFETYQRSGRLVGTLPTHDGLALVAVYAPIAEFPTIRRDPRGAFLAAIRSTAPELAERLTAGAPVERLRGTNDQRNFVRQAYGPGWALVGDAGYHKDSITGRGITDAFEQAAMLDDCVGDGLRDDARLAQGLRRYAARRARWYPPIYQSALACANLDVSPRQVSMLRFLATRQELVDRYYAVGAGLLAPEELYNAQLSADITAYYAGARR